MGATLGRLFAHQFCKHQFRVVLIGSHSSGRTTALYHLKDGIFHDNMIPTIGFNVETVSMKKVKLDVWDLGGACKIREIWHHYYEGAQGIVVFINACQIDNNYQVEETLRQTRKALECTPASCPFMFLINKTDLTEVSPERVRELYQLGQLMGKRTYRIMSASAKTGQGLRDSFEWLSDQIMRHQ